MKSYSKRLIIFVFPALLSVPLRGLAEEPSVLDLIQMDVGDLRNITITTAGKRPQQRSEAPAVVRVVSAEQIARRGYFTLEDVLADLPGFQFRNIQGFNSYSFLRGAPSQNNLLLLLVDGVQVNELNSGGFYGGAQFNLANVERIEVVYGPASALYGTNAISGVINIITRAADDSTRHIGLGAGSFDTRAADFRAAGGAGAWHYAVAGLYKSTDKPPLGGAAGDRNWSEDMENFEDDWAVEAKLSGRGFHFGFLYQDKQASRTTNYRGADTNYAERGTLWHIRFANLWLKHAHEWNDKLGLNSLAYYRDTTVLDDTIAYIERAVDGNPGRQAAYYRPGQQLGVDEQLLYQPWDALELTAGLEWRYTRLSDGFSVNFSEGAALTPSAPGEPSRLGEHLLSLYVQGLYRFTPSLSTTLGLRQDYRDAYKNVTTPRAALVYAGGALTWKLLYSEAFRAPKPWDYHFGAGNPDLEAETMRSLESYLDYHFTSALGLALSLYRNEIKGKLNRDAEAQRWINLGGLRSDGAELEVNFAVESFDAYLNYSYVDSHDENGVMSAEIAKHSWNAGMNYRFTAHWNLNARVNYSGKRPNPGASENIAAFLTAHAALTYRHGKNWLLRLDARNLFDRTYYHTSNRPPTRYRQAQRAVFLDARYQF